MNCSCTTLLLVKCHYPGKKGGTLYNHFKGDTTEGGNTMKYRACGITINQSVEWKLMLDSKQAIRGYVKKMYI